MRIIFLLSFVILAACAKPSSDASSASSGNACANVDQLGTWFQNSSNDTLTLDASCKATSSACQSQFTFTAPNQDMSTLTVHASNGSGSCLPLGSHDCHVTINPYGQLRINCYGSVSLYDRI